jgi:hypothetical protein
LETSQVETLLLNTIAWENISFIVVTDEVSHDAMSPLPEKATAL